MTVKQKAGDESDLDRGRAAGDQYTIPRKLRTLNHQVALDECCAAHIRKRARKGKVVERSERSIKRTPLGGVTKRNWLIEQKKVFLEIYE